MSKRTRGADDGSTSRKPRKRKTKKQQSSLPCEWVDCTFDSIDDEEFLIHVESHEAHLEVREVDGSNRTFYCCMWESCGYDSERAAETRYHINYHSYHTQIKILGNQLLIDKPTLACYLDHAGRNLLPVLPTEIQCEWNNCSFVTNSFQRMIGHTFSFHISNQPCRKWDEPVDCQWKGCTKHFKSTTDLRSHLKTHTQEKGAGCPVCGGQFFCKQKLQDHLIRQLPASDRKYKCSYCKKYYHTERILKDHIRLHWNKFKCPFCEMTCPTKPMLSRHIRLRHLSERPFKCNFCDHRSKSEDDLEKHHEIHCEENVWVCEMSDCEFSCRSKQSLKLHYVKAHPEEAVAEIYACHLCDKKWNRGSALTTHLKKKHNYRRAPGQARFRYVKDDDGVRRLQVLRYEKIEETQPTISSKLDCEPRSRAPKKFTCLSVSKDQFVITENVADNVSRERIDAEDDPDDPEEADGDMRGMDEEDDHSMNDANNDTAEDFDNSNDSGRSQKKKVCKDDIRNLITAFVDDDSEEDEDTNTTPDEKYFFKREGDSESEFEESIQRHLGIKDGSGFVKVIRYAET